MTDTGSGVLPRQIDATVSYLARSEEPLYNYYFMEPPPGKLPSNEVREPHRISITDMRDLPAAPSLDVEGFMLAPFETRARDIYDAAEREAVYDPEMIGLVKRVTGASEVRVFQPFLRGPEAQRRAPGSISAPAGTTHVDYTLDTGPMWFDAILGEDADRFRGRRYAFINVWRPITGPLRDHPLAVCDARTVARDDLMTSLSFSLVGADGLHSGDGELEESAIYSVAWNPRHRWFYARDMMPDEVLLLKNYDSRGDVARFVPHCAFSDPTAPPDVLPRASIEVRALTIW